MVMVVRAKRVNAGIGFKVHCAHKKLRRFAVTTITVALFVVIVGNRNELVQRVDRQHCLIAVALVALDAEIL